MTATYAQLQKQIAGLHAQASKLKQEEVASVIEKIKELVSVYELTAQDIFESRAGGKVATRSKAKRSTVAYSDGKGNTWSGRGPRPQWLRDALASGKSLEDFSSRGSKAVSAPKAQRSAPKKAGRRNGRAKYRDDAGNTWTGHGRRPQWFKDAIAGGKKLEDLTG
jgi:DNA-binding protein H-NS